MTVLIILGILAILLLYWINRKTTICTKCNKRFSIRQALAGKVMVRLNNVICTACANSINITKDILSDAINTRNKITFDYTTKYGTSKRVVDPYLIEGGRLHGWCNEYKDIRTFSVNKMKKWDVLNTLFQYDDKVFEDINARLNISPEEAGCIVYREKKPSKKKLS